MFDRREQARRGERARHGFEVAFTETAHLHVGPRRDIELAVAEAFAHGRERIEGVRRQIAARHAYAHERAVIGDDRVQCAGAAVRSATRGERYHARDHGGPGCASVRSRASMPLRASTMRAHSHSTSLKRLRYSSTVGWMLPPAVT